MFHTAANLAHYLVARGLVTQSCIVDGDFIIVEAGRRNRNFKVFCGQAPGLFIKQAQSTDPAAVSTLQREAAFYGLCHFHPFLAELVQLTPRFVDFDPASATLVTELFSEWESVGELQLRVGSEYPPELAASIGRALGTYHRAADRVLHEPHARALFPCELPWIMRLSSTEGLNGVAFGNPGAQLATLLRTRPGLFEKVVALARHWQIDSIVHGDLKWDNFLVHRPNHGNVEVRVIDWELVDLGDASWDVAAVFVSYLASWVWGSPRQHAAEGLDAEQLKKIRPAMKAFWQSYSIAREFAPQVAQPYLHRCMRFCGARLVVALFEQLYNMPSVTLGSLGMLQLSEYILKDTPVATTELLTG